MLFLENLLLAFTSLLTNKMRSLLTMLGIIIGIGSVIAIVTVGNSLTNSITSEMSDMGANNITVGIQQRESEDESYESGMRFAGLNNYKVPTDEDMITGDMIRELIDEFPDKIEGVSVDTSLGEAKVESGRNYANIELIGVSPGYFKANNVKVTAGKELSSKAYEDGKGVCIVSDRFVSNMFDGDNDKAIGHEVEIELNGGGHKYYVFTIVGIYEYESQGFSMTSEKDIQTPIYIPLNTALSKNHKKGFYSFTVITAPGIDSDEFALDVKGFMNRYYHNNRNFTITTFSLASMVSAMTSMLGTVSTAISVIAAISLVVGGIGVMNIMLVSISERTKEIGTRKALGATNGSIRAQFIMEAIALCLVGGVLGIIVGILGGAAGAKAMGYAASPSPGSIVAALLFSMAVGVFFGFYPANKAAKMNPIDALRYE
ncbi:MAG: ABC transporter permease [Lachnospiraceae bacterium]|nr:ABC transporter permease [Lachnospiraceae bacterium]